MHSSSLNHGFAECAGYKLWNSVFAVIISTLLHHLSLKITCFVTPDCCGNPLPSSFSDPCCVGTDQQQNFNP